MRDHSHYAVKYRGKYTGKCAAQAYNLKYSIPKEITIIFHNFLTTMIIILSQKK